MGLGNWLGRSKIYTVTDTEDAAFLEQFTVYKPLSPDWQSGSASCYRGGMSIPGAFRAATLRADRLGMFPFHLFRERAGLCEQLLTPPILDQPNPPFTRMTSLSQLALDLIWHGNGIAVITSRYADGSPAALTPVPAQAVGVGRDPDTGRVAYSVGGGAALRVEPKTYDYSDVLHVMGHAAPGQLRGMGVLEAHFRTLELSAELGTQARGLSSNGVPTGLLKAASPDTPVANLVSAKASWLLSQRTRTVAALSPGVDFLPLSWDPEQMQLVESRKFSHVELAQIFGIPAYWLDAEGPSMTYSNGVDKAADLLKYTAVGADVERFEQALSLLFVRGTYVKANLDAVLRPDTRARYETYGLGISAGWLLKSEARALEDLPPVPGIDDPPEPPAALPPVDPGKVDPNADPPVEA